MAATTFNELPLDIFYTTQFVQDERSPLQCGGVPQVHVFNHNPVILGTVTGRVLLNGQEIQTFVVSTDGQSAEIIPAQCEGIFLTSVKQRQDSIEFNFNRAAEKDELIDVALNYEYDANGTSSYQEEGRDMVWEAIQTEREYQVRRWGHRQEDGSFLEVPHTVCDFLVYMKNYLDDAFKAASTKNGDEAALDELRKVVTLGVACFEQHGIEPRDLNNIVNGRDGQPA